ncbi:MAG: AIR synthase-related protein [Candidatus Nanoarchaeia archaeon]|nr:AIR synthase-related protein [Candidatus Nanoarchaeia archaeon]MDD5238938.1 AIR synthase-related protein [Candidatus Nanoarchaeia archaeon]
MPRATRIEIESKISDTRADVRRKKFETIVPAEKIKEVRIRDVYTIDKEFSGEELQKISAMLVNPVTEKPVIGSELPKSPEKGIELHAIEVGYLPGVTDNVSHTVKEGIADLFGTEFAPDEGVYTSQVTLIEGNLSPEELKTIKDSMANPLIQRISTFDYKELESGKGFPTIVPKVKLNKEPSADLVDILNATDEELAVIGKKGIANADGTRRGPLALDITYMKTIQGYFKNEKRNPTDVELESIAQTWSEHCKHTIFADKIDDIGEGLYKAFIKSATNTIRKRKGKKDFCVSVFTDNAGGIVFDKDYIVTHKVETHNSPSALDPFGGSITGIVGVNRDAIGFGLGAKPIFNIYGFCFADPNDTSPLYKGENFTQKMLSSRKIMDGVIEGVNVGGNCSGIPTPQGFVFFNEGYKGKPLVFVGTGGLIPVESCGRDSCQKKAEPGDYIVMVGGRVGKDGIHGATFSSEAMDSGSPATAVQIGDPITQKKLSDAIVKEARDMGLYTSITDNGAGGLSCSVAEMARECGGCYVNLNAVPLKYPGLEPWEIWISESQERMTLSVPKDKWAEFSELMENRGVEATVIGEFTDSGRCIVDYKNKIVMDVDMEFLHDGLPQRPIKTKRVHTVHEAPEIPLQQDWTETLHEMLKRPNIASFEFISQQYDHEVQGGSVLKPLQGAGRVNGDATVIRPLLTSKKGVVLSQGINPTYSSIDTYHMAACAIDTAIRNAVAAGADMEHLALLDNFCWCSSDEPERLFQLKEAARACHDFSIAYGTPFISGKDSMFNDFKGYNEKGEKVKISVPPTLLISSIGVIEDAAKSVSLDAKCEGDIVYILGTNMDELGGSEYFAMEGEKQRGKPYIGNNVPKVYTHENKKTYNALSKAIDAELVASVQSVDRGGVSVALVKTAMGGMLGMDISLAEANGVYSRDDYSLFSQSPGRLVVTVAPQYKDQFEDIMHGTSIAEVGTVRGDNRFIIRGIDDKEIVSTTVDSLLKSYKSTFEGY